MEKKILDKLDSFDFSLQQKRMLVEVIKDIIVSTKSDVPAVQSDPLLPLFEAAGATYIPETDTYTVNGVNGITKDEICRMYFTATNNHNEYNANAINTDLRKDRTPTNFIKNPRYTASAVPYESTFRGGNVKNVVIDIPLNDCIYASTPTYMFYNSKCVNISPILDFKYLSKNITFLDKTFYLCKDLENVKIRNLAVGLSFAYSNKLTADTIKYLVENSDNTQNIVVYVHVDVFDKIEKNEGKWIGIKEAATEKNITFATN